jgi:hypothetical protein
VWDVAEGPQQEAASDAVVVPRQEVAAAASGVAAVLQREVAALAWDAAVVPQREVAAAAWAVVVEPQQEAARVGVAVPRQVVAVRQQEARGAGAAALLQGAPDVRAALPSAVPWVFRRGPPPPWLAPRPAAQPAHAMARSRIATP